MNHKRRRPKHQRAGCLLCKPHKDERVTKVAPASAERRMQPDDGDLDLKETLSARKNCYCNECWPPFNSPFLPTSVPLTHRLDFRNLKG